MRRPFTGVGTALVTPFRRDGSLDEAAVKRLARRQIDAGVHFVSPCGTTGEAPTLNHREKLRVVELVVEEARPRAGAGRRRRLRHARGRSSWRATWSGSARTASCRSRRTTTSRRRKACISTTRRSPRARAADRALQRPGPHRRQPGRPHDGSPVRDSATSSAIKERRAIWSQMSEIIAGARDDFMLLSGDDPVTVAVDGRRRRGRGLGGVERGAGGDGADRRAVREGRLCRPRASCTTGCCRCSR